MSKINIVQIQAALKGVPITAAFIVDTLGVQPVETVKRAVFWDAADYGKIVGRLQNHLNSCSAIDPSTLSGERTKKEPPPAAASEDFFNESAPAGGDDFFAEEPEDFFQ